MKPEVLCIRFKKNNLVEYIICLTDGGTIQVILSGCTSRTSHATELIVTDAPVLKPYPFIVNVIPPYENKIVNIMMLVYLLGILLKIGKYNYLFGILIDFVNSIN